MTPTEFENFKPKLKNYKIIFDEDDLYKELEPYDERSVRAVFKDIVRNHPRLGGMNILYELGEGLRDKQPIETKSHWHIREYCEICGNSGFVSLHNQDNYSYSFLCKCSMGNYLKENNPKMATWNGKLEQYLKNERYILDDCFSCRINS
jgi:hypothetical protein